ncbi:hypothetical protein [Gordonia alkanivorans]|uniref:hypothetical protein n=1 Tax=Gordonia alkanivorans TaxID=84096 RepID=UPI0024B69110|nr:hypothetical protein [Gordonia alkanivorans]MDJ0006510.1 hypothetical protein [Gordonia alkanivorans]MDJ0492138.1 hypothetical protein [Gordonia alkanivorans]
MTDYVLTASRFDQVLERDASGFPLKVVKHRRGALISGLSAAEAARLKAAGAIGPAPDPADEVVEVVVVEPATTEVVVEPADDAVTSEESLATAEAEHEAAQAEADEARADAAEQVAELNARLEEPVRPKITATKKVWVEYAVARGWKVADAEKLDKQELIEALS